jgi:ABC-type bacteriocin/lantibiotic exporters, contain an N-terminal double-glycine peptidase domain
MKNVKMAGLTETISSSLRDLRSAEIDASFPFRLYETLGITLGMFGSSCEVFANNIGFASSSLAPVFGFGVYVILAEANDTATLTNGLAFSALTLFSLLDQPMGSIVNGSEDLMAVVNCFQRIQKHLMEAERLDRRLRHDTQGSLSVQGTSKVPLIETDSSAWEHHIEPCAILRNLSVAWSIDTEPVLKDLNTNIQESKVTMIVGPVGSGKSTFLKMLMGRSQNILAQSPPASLMPHIVVSCHGLHSGQFKKILWVHRHGIDPGTTRLRSYALYRPISNNFLREIRQKSAFGVLDSVVDSKCAWYVNLTLCMRRLGITQGSLGACAGPILERASSYFRRRPNGP